MKRPWRPTIPEFNEAIHRLIDEHRKSYEHWLRHRFDEAYEASAKHNRGGRPPRSEVA